MKEFRKRWLLKVTCDGCGVRAEEYGEEKSYPPHALRSAGWRLGKRDICPDCSRKPSKQRS